jgi:uncharacterized protein (TIGR03435 family)
MPTGPSRAILSVLLVPAVLTARGAPDSSSRAVARTLEASQTQATVQQQPPIFKAGVRLVEVDVTVRDKDRFVDTLTTDDFEVLEDGKPQQIQQLWVVNLPVDRLPNPPAAVATPLAVVGSAADVGRLYVLVLGSGGLESVRGIARQFITEFLGPTDLMAIVHISNRAATQGLTASRELLLDSVDRYRGGGGPEASLEMLREVAVSLSASTGRRKAVLFTGHGVVMWSPQIESDTKMDWALVERGVRAYKMERVFQDMVTTAKRNNVRIYPIDPDGFQPGGSLRYGGGDGDRVASLRILAADTGGIAIANTNNYRGNFPHIVRDNSAYYLLTYNSSAESDGHAHPITVRLRNRPDLTVRQGRQSFSAPSPDVKGRSVRLPRSLSAAARAVLSASTPVHDSGIELFTAVFQAPDFHGSILIGTHVPGTLLRLAPKDTIELSYVAVDRWGAVRAVERRPFTLNLSAQNRARVERTGLRLFGRLQLPRGQYQIRVAAHQANGTTASAAADVEVPDYIGQPLTISDFVVASSQGRTLMTLEEDALLRGALPAQPTPERRFSRGETLTVVAEICDSHWIVSQEVGVTMTVAAADGRIVFRGEQILTSANRGRFYLKGTLPLGPFVPGDYQLLVEAHTRKGIPANASQQMRFAVLDSEAPAVSGGTRAVLDVPQFEFVSVRRSPTVSATPAAGTAGTRAGLLVLPDGRFEARGQTLESLARVAFGFEDVARVSATAVWMSNDRFDITASTDHRWTTPPTGTTVPVELRSMLRALLEDRFALMARVEPRNADVTALLLAKPDVLGPGLRRSEAACRGPFTDAAPDEAPPRPRCPFMNASDRIQAEAVTIDEAARLVFQHPSFAWRVSTVDQTGLSGRFDLSFSIPQRGFTPERRIEELETQLGLRLRLTRMPLPTLIIERASRPKEN